MSFNSSNPLGYLGTQVGINPVFITASRAPTANDIYTAGTEWFNQNTLTIYVTTGAGAWQAGGNVQATTTVAGITRYATYTEVSTGTGTNNAALAADVYTYINTVAIAGAPAATQVVVGISRYATNVEAAAAALTTASITPSNLASIFASPPATGGSTPAAGAFTTLSFTTATGTAGGTWATGGTAISIGADATTDTINIGTGAAARSIHIGDSTQANLVTIGSATGAAALTLKAGTGNFVLTTAATTTVTMGAAQTSGTFTIGGTAATGNLTLGSSSASNSILIGDGSGTTTVNIANSGANNILNVGAAMVGGTITIGGTAQTGTLTLGSSSAANSVIIAGGSGATTLSIANVQNGGSVSVGLGLTTGTILIGGVAASRLEQARQQIVYWFRTGLIQAHRSLASTTVRLRPTLRSIFFQVQAQQELAYSIWQIMGESPLLPLEMWLQRRLGQRLFLAVIRLKMTLFLFWEAIHLPILNLLQYLVA